MIIIMCKAYRKLMDRSVHQWLSEGYNARRSVHIEVGNTGHPGSSCFRDYLVCNRILKIKICLVKHNKLNSNPLLIKLINE